MTPTTSAPAPTPTPTPTLTLPSRLRVVGIGDSVTAASHCDCQGFVADYGHLLQQRYDVPVTAVEYGVPGATTTSMLPSLGGHGTVAVELAHADVISVTIGANDLEAARADYADHRCGGSDDLRCFTPAVAAMKAGLDADLTAITRLTAGAGHPVQVLVNDYWNVFEDGQVALRLYGAAFAQDSGAMTREANTAICTAAAAHGAICVDTYAPFKGSEGTKDPTSLLAADGNHPDAAGHAAIARAMLACGLPAFES
jgi:lysophospholipase L1-like esterase